MTIDPTTIPHAELHALLQAAVAPRPIAFVSTIDEAGRVNLSPFSFFNVFSTNPPILVFSPSRRGRDNTTKHTYDNLLQVPEAVVSTVNFAMVEQVSLASTEYDRGVNEFVKAGFTEAPSMHVRPPRVAESPAAFECIVEDIVKLGDQGGAGNLVVARVAMAHVQERYLDASGRLDTTKLDLVGRMGGNWYTRASGDALFEIPKPLQTKGIGVDRLPTSVRNSAVLTGNNLGRLGNVEMLPTRDEVAETRSDPDVAWLLANESITAAERTEALHRLAQRYLEGGATETALRVLLVEE